MTNALATRPTPAPTDKQVLDTARVKVAELLQRSPSYLALPLEKRREIAKNTVEVLRYLSAPEGIPGNTLPTAQPTAAPMAGPQPGNTRGSRNFTAEGAREGAEVAGVILQQVSFPAFVSGLINGVFESIVNSSIKQMEAYGQLVANVAKSLNDFRDENITANQGRDYITDKFPDLFDLDTGNASGGDGSGPRIRLRSGVDEDRALSRINQLPIEGGPVTSLDLDDDEVEDKIVQAARTQLASSRQQLLATMVMMGINRIIVTDGKIQAKVKYDFKARDTFQRSATSFDYENFGNRTVSEGQYESNTSGGSYSKDSDGAINQDFGSYYGKGIYKTTTEPAIQITSMEAVQQQANLETSASLMGNVDISFKSETFPLEKLADSFQIGQIQAASERKGNAQSPRAAPTQSSNAPTTPPTTQSPTASPVAPAR